MRPLLIHIGDGPLPEGMLSYEQLIGEATPVDDAFRGGDVFTRLLVDEAWILVRLGLGVDGLRLGRLGFGGLRRFVSRSRRVAGALVLHDGVRWSDVVGGAIRVDFARARRLGLHGSGRDPREALHGKLVVVVSLPRFATGDDGRALVPALVLGDGFVGGALLLRQIGNGRDRLAPPRVALFAVRIDRGVMLGGEVAKRARVTDHG